VLVIEPAPGSPVHVSGAGANGLAPHQTDPLERRAAVLTLTVGAATLRVIARVAPAGGGWVMTVGAPPGLYYEVACGQRTGTTPLRDVRLGAPTTCAITAPDGRAGRFAIRLVP